MKMDEGSTPAPMAMTERVRDRRRHDRGRIARRAGAARRRPDGARARRAGARRAAVHAAAGRRRHLCGEDRQGRDADRLDASRGRTVHDHIRGLSPFPGAWCEMRGRAAVKVLRTTRGEGSGAPGTVLDDRLTIACGDGAVRIVELQRPAAGRCAPRNSCAARPFARASRSAEPCRATSSSSNMTARRSPAGSTRTMRRRCRARSMTAIAAFSGEKVDGAGRRPHRRRRACARPGRAFRSRQRARRPTPCATRSTRICGRIRSRSCRPNRCAADFDARLSAMRRHYLYRIVNRRPDLALDRGRAWRVPRPLDAAAMHAAAQRLVGKHDFTTFRSTECQAKSPEKTLDRLDVSRAGDEIQSPPSARSFLHNQVRSMVGSLVLVGEGKWSADDLAARARRPRPHGLRAGGAAGRALSGAGGLLSAYRFDHAQRKYLSRIFRYTAVSVCRSGDRHALVDGVHGRADQAELDHRAIVLDEARVRGAAGGRQLRLACRSPRRPRRPPRR